jgi:hypothetical protein
MLVLKTNVCRVAGAAGLACKARSALAKALLYLRRLV